MECKHLICGTNESLGLCLVQWAGQKSPLTSAEYGNVAVAEKGIPAGDNNSRGRGAGLQDLNVHPVGLLTYPGKSHVQTCPNCVMRLRVGANCMSGLSFGYTSRFVSVGICLMEVSEGEMSPEPVAGQTPEPLTFIGS